LLDLAHTTFPCSCKKGIIIREHHFEVREFGTVIKGFLENDFMWCLQEKQR
jgi:hypothetical protein